MDILKRTNLEKVKDIARMFLYMDVGKTKFSPMIIKHPFADSGITMVRNEEGNFETVDLMKKEDLEKWRKQVEQMIIRAESAFELHMLVVQYVRWYMQLSEMEQIKFKAIAEAEPFQDFSQMKEVRENFADYEFMYYCDDAQSFFKEHLLHNLDARYDSEWLKTLLCETEGRELLEQLGATLTSYGVVSARGVPLYSLVPCKQDSEIVQEEVDELEEIGGISQ